MTAPPQDELPDLTVIGERVQREVERAVQRNLKGLDFLTAPKQPVGASASDQLLRRGMMALYRYRPQTDEVYRIPLLIVSPPSNKGYIFDLATGQSFVEFMLQRGYDVFLLDWMPARSDESGLGFEEFVFDFIHTSVRMVQELTGEEQVTLAGYCMGGTITAMYAALFPELVANLLFFATPIDFQHMHLFQRWGHRDHFDVDRLVASLGNIPPEFMLGVFDLMRPANRAAGALQLWTNMWNDDFVKSYRMFDRWAAETLPTPGRYFAQLVKELLWNNALVEGTLKLGGRPVRLDAITAPLISIVAQHDHVVQREAALPLIALTGSAEREEIISKGGHVSVVAGPGAVRRLWPSIDNWLGKKSV